MKVSFRKSGGFAAIFEGVILDSGKMSAEESKELSALIQSSDILNQKGKRHESARDVHLFTFEVDYNGQHNKVTFDQLSVPNEVKPLLDFLTARSKDMMPDV